MTGLEIQSHFKVISHRERVLKSMQVKTRSYIKIVKERYEYLVLAFLQLAVVLMVPSTISYDGFLYLASGKSLFSGNFPHWYVVIREPGYPFLIWLTLRFQDPIFILTLIQSFLLVASAILVLKISREHFQFSRFNSFLVSAIGLLLVRGYAVSILQSTLIIFICTTSTYFLLSKNFIERKLTAMKLFKWGFFGVLCASTNTAFLAVITLSFIIICIFDKQIRIVNVQLVAFVIGAFLLIIPWNLFLNTVDLNAQAIPSFRSGASLNLFVGDSLMSQNSQRIQAVGSMLHLGPEIYVGLDPKSAVVSGEHLIFGMPINYHQWSACNRRMGAPDYILNFVGSFLKENCMDNWSLKFQSAISKAMLPFLPLSGVALLMNLGIAIQGRDFKRLKLVLIPILSILIYGYKGAGNSRYSSAFLIFGPLLIFLVIKQTYRTVDDFKKKR